MQSLTSQFYAFAVTILMGLTIGILFEIYRVTKGAVRPGKTMTYLGDFLFWVISTLVVFFMLLVGNWGELRFYVLIGVMLGVFLYIKLFSGPLIKLLNWLVDIIKKLVTLVLKIMATIWLIITYPIIILKKIIIIPIGFIGTAYIKLRNLAKLLTGRFITGPLLRKMSQLKISIKRRLTFLLKK